MADMDSWLNYHHLYYFKVIATEGSIARAAQVLRLGQPTLSAQLKQFEDKLSIQLFERQHKKLILTESGRIALEYAGEIFRLGSEMSEVLHDRLVPSRPHVQLGALDSVPKNIIFRLVRAAYRISPCRVSVLEGGDSELVRELLAHRIDLILTNHRPVIADVKKLYIKSLAKMPVVICGSQKFKALKKGFPKSLLRQPLILPTAHSRLRHELDHYFHTNEIQPDIIAETQDTSLQKIMGAQGLGLIAVAETAVRTQVKKGELEIIGTVDGVSEELFMVAASRKIENPISSRLLKSFEI